MYSQVQVVAQLIGTKNWEGGVAIPPGVQGTEFIESYADVLKSESCAKLVKLSDKVTLTSWQ